MKKFLLACSALAIGFAYGSAVQAQTVTIKMATFTPPKGLMAVDIMDPWAAKVEKDSGGDVKFERYYGGTLGRDPGQYLKLVEDGVSDVGHVVSHYVVGRFPDDDLFNLPGLMNNALESSIAYTRFIDRKILRGYEGLRIVGAFSTGPTAIHVKPAIKGLSDLKGLKLRTSGEGMTEAARLMGAVGVPLAAPAIAENISRGLIDGVMLDWVAMDLFGVPQVAKYHYDINIGSIPNVLAMNQKTYASLSPRAKKAVDTHGGEAFAKHVGDFNKTFDDNNRDKLAKSGQHTIIKPTAADQAQLDKLLAPMHEEWKKGRPDGEKKYAELQKILAEIRAGK